MRACAHQKLQLPAAPDDPPVWYNTSDRKCSSICVMVYAVRSSVSCTDRVVRFTHRPLICRRLEAAPLAELEISQPAQRLTSTHATRPMCERGCLSARRAVVGLLAMAICEIS